MMTKRGLFCYILLILRSRPNIAGLPSSHDSPDDEYLNFSVIDNAEVRRYAEEYNALCPHTALCDVNVNINDSLLWTMDLEFRKKPCCRGCFCNNCMGSRECCIDVLPRLLTSEEVRVVHEDPSECIFTQYR